VGIIGSQEGKDAIASHRSQYDPASVAFLNELGKLRSRGEGGKGPGRQGVSRCKRGEGDGIHHPRVSGGRADHPGPVQEEPHTTSFPLQDAPHRTPHPSVGLPAGPPLLERVRGGGHEMSANPTPLAAATSRSIRSRMTRARLRRSFRGSQAI
jgi:hypothetical protein